MKKGFTLIELLAVIVILAIIALIATPIILNIIGDTKDSSIVRSGELYLDAVEQAIARKNLKEQINPSRCIIESDGNITCGEENLVIEVKGSRPIAGIIILKKGKISKVNRMVFDGYILRTEGNNRLVNIGKIKDYTPQGTYLMVNPFVSSADTPFLGGTINRSQVETITVTNTKTVPSEAIGSWDVSAKQDKSIMAWYTDIDNNDLYELYIGGDGGVKANPNSSRLFQNFINVTAMDLKYLDTSNVTTMLSMFYRCYNLKKLDINNFNTSKVTNMWDMFYRCTSLTSIDLSSFDTSNVTNMSGVFQECTKLITLDLSNFDTGKVTNMSDIFYKCSSLTDLNISSFNTNKVIDMQSMFNGCSNLTSIDVNNFDTVNVTNMKYMFNGCKNLTSIDLSSFDTSNVTNIQEMFSGCINISTLDLKNMDFTNVTEHLGMFSECNNLISLTVKNTFSQEFINTRLTDVNKTGVTVTIAL